MKIIVCRECGKKNKISGRLKGRSCKECGARLDLQDRTPEGMSSSQVLKKTSAKRVFLGGIIIAFSGLLIYFAFTVPLLAENYLLPALLVGGIIFLIGVGFFVFRKKKVVVEIKPGEKKKGSFLGTLIGGILMIAAMVIMIYLFTVGIGFLEDLPVP